MTKAQKGIQEFSGWLRQLDGAHCFPADRKFFHLTSWYAYKNWLAARKRIAYSERVRFLKSLYEMLAKDKFSFILRNIDIQNTICNLS